MTTQGLVPEKKTDVTSTDNKGEQYIDLKNNGRLFPLWVLRNFKKYKLPEMFINESADMCNGTVKLELRKYQMFIEKYLGPKSPYNEILLYHGLGSGKTATSINIMNVFYNSNPNVNLIVLIKASLRDDPWMKDLKKWLQILRATDTEDSKIYKSINFIHYDSPNADKKFIETMKSIDTSKQTLYIIDEVHNFIRNVHSNIKSKSGKRAQVIYEHIMKDRKENRRNKLVIISATPGINTPFELALTFNLLRPGIFPSSELEFNRLFVTESNYPILSPSKKNLFERRIMGLVSYYIGATPDLYAKQRLKYIDLEMSRYQYSVYRYYENIEAKFQKQASRYKKVSKLYRTYTRQACNFVFPAIDSNINGELRPRPGKFRVSEPLADNIMKGKNIEANESDVQNSLNSYMIALENFVRGTAKYFNDIKKKDQEDKHTIFDDLEDFKSKFERVYDGKFINFYRSSEKKSRLFNQMYDCSPKMTAIAFMTYISPGKTMVYSNYVLMEGLDMMKLYYEMIGYNNYIAGTGNCYCEYNGRIDPADRTKIKVMFNDSNNINGEKCKIILLSPSATEGIELTNIRQEHIMEPYWTEVRIQQVIGRAIRQCSHKELPLSERIVDVYRYKVHKPSKLDDGDTVRASTDSYVEYQAKAKDNLIQSFLSAMKEAAIDCELFRNHNMLTQSYSCFKFPEESIMNKNVGPAYREDIKEDIRIDSGLHAANAKIERVKVIKIKGVYAIGKDKNGDYIYSQPEIYWYYPINGMIYDYETHYPVGRVEFINNMPAKIDKDTFIISNLIHIPTIADGI